MSNPAIKHLPANPELTGFARIIPDIIFSRVIEEGLKLTLMLPWTKKNEEKKILRPLIVFVQGCSWGFPDINKQIPQLSQYARMGFAVATVTHRNAENGHPFPAYLQDVKTAIRFLRAHAEEYAIDPAHVCIFGTSSGGNTAMLIGLTGDDEQFKTEEYRQFSDHVNCVVECFGPTDLPAMMPDNFDEMMKNPAYADLPLIRRFRGLCGNRAEMEVLADMSPVKYLATCKNPPPMLLLHGDDDEMVPYAQATLMYEKLSEAGAIARMICVDGAPHEGSFWSEQVNHEIQSFIGEYIR